MNNMKLSILVLSYNQEMYIERTIESIAHQVFDGKNTEIVVADDCSEDNTQSIILKMSKKYHFVKPIFNKKNLGVVENYFNAISHCSGELFMVCGGDDYFLPEKISTQLDFMKSCPDVALCCSGKNVVDSNGRLIRRDISNFHLINFDDLILKNEIASSSICLRMSILREYISSIDPKNRSWGMEDYPMWLWISSQRYKIAYIPQILVGYTEQDGTVSRPYEISKKIEFEKSVYDIRSFFCKKNQMRKIDSMYIKGIAKIYLKARDISNFRKYVMKDHSLIGILNLLFSFLPFYFCFYEKLRIQKKYLLDFSSKLVTSLYYRKNK